MSDTDESQPIHSNFRNQQKKKNPKANTRNEAMRSPQRKVISRRTHAWLVTVNESVKAIL